ncbi:LOW QUALITY PROTEIN: msx2-interacting protein [Rana temporaria]|uniref:LOW QUALITY PROTEIN: msx2-interacting protein n=1 Tax=Rana temporaria TaxID=8407 RepID=UPI001AAD52F6|nr:LOW QUALITY PROTEIN: msx2-interacting protein [Rana temporaria]
MVRETRHLWVGNLPENVRDDKIIEHFKRYGRVESVKILPKRGSDGGVAAFVDFVDIKSAQKAHNAVNKMGDRDLRTDYNEPGTIPGAARVLDETVSITSRSREVSGFRGGSGGPAYGPPQSLHAREGRYERRLDGSDSSSTSSDESPARSVQSAAVPAPPVQPLLSLDKDEPRKSFGIKVQNLPVRSTDTSLKDGLFHEFKKYGKVTSVQIHGVSEERYGLVFFRQQEDQEKALNASKGKLFFGMQIEVTAWVGPETESENEFRPLDERIDEFHPKATRTLFIGNLEKTTTHLDLHNVFQRFGDIVDIDVKKLNGVPQYAFLQYSDITSVCKAIKKMDGEYLGNNRLKLGFGKSMPTNCVWIDGLPSNVTDQYLTRHFSRYGPVLKVVYDRFKGMALILYSEIEFAQAAVKETKGRKIGGTIVKVDFANQESQLAFYGSMESSGQDIRDIYEIISERRSDDTRRGSFHELTTTTERTYYDTVRTTGTYPEETRREYPARSRELYQDWETYQGDYYEQRYYEDSREYRDYRDPYEQDIREYSYRQRERERERERFETDRERDGERRPVERSQSPARSRRPQSPAGSPSASERITSDPERRIYSRSSDRSGSCSSVSPSRFEKLEKARAERYIKSEKLDKEHTFDAERLDKEKRLLRKERTDKILEKDKADRAKRKSKNHSASSQSSETDPDNEKESSLEKQKGSSKLLAREKNDKDSASKNRLDLMPCVVLTRVTEKEGKVFDPPSLEKATKIKADSESMKSPPLDPKTQIMRLEQSKFEQIKAESRSKVPKEKLLSSHVEVVDKESKQKLKKHLKQETPTEGASAADLDKLEARKRRFADANLKCDRQKLDVRRNNTDEDDLRLSSRKQLDSASSRDFSGLREGDFDRKSSRKELSKRDSRKSKSERLFNISSPKDSQDHSLSVRSNSDLQLRLGEPVDEQFDSPDASSKKINFMKNLQRHVQMGDDLDKDASKEERKAYCNLLREGMGLERTENEEKLAIDIDYTQSYRKQMEQNRKLKQQMELEILKSEKFGSPSKEAEEYERRSLVHEVGKPPQDVTDDSPPSKKKKTDHVDFEVKPERHYRSSRQISDEPERIACSPSVRPFMFNEDDFTLNSPRLMPIKEFKESPQVDEKNMFSSMAPKDEPYKLIPSDPIRKEHVSDHFAKPKFTAVSPEEEYGRWGDSQIKQESNRMDISFPSNVVKREGIRKRSKDLEPGEVPSDSDEDSDHKSASPKVSSILDGSRFSYLLRDGDDKRDKEERLSGSLERHRFLDKTITPDTKALLERAKSLSSSREENWSFLEWDSKLASLRNSKEREKVDSAPRPIPSWYMKKKKIKTDSDGKIDDKKDDHKEEEQEKQELFASRFLHSSIFEQDSKRLQHLERKDEDTDLCILRPYGRQLSSDGISSTSELVQEPVVLFHSRFIELTRMQQKEKEKEQRPKEQEKPEEKENQPRTPETVPENKERENKSPVSIVPIPPPPPPPPLPQPEPVAPPPPEKIVVEKMPSPPTVPPIEDKPAEPCEMVADETSSPKVVAPVTPPIAVHPPTPVETVQAVDETDETPAIPPVPEELPTGEHITLVDTKPPSPGASFPEVSTDPVAEIKPVTPTTSPSKADDKAEEVEAFEESTPVFTGTETDACEKNETVPEDTEPLISENDLEAEAPTTAKNKKTSKGKRSSAVDKPATRKSIRIDREKRNRSASPRVESQKHSESKVEHDRSSRSSAKSPSAVPEVEASELSLPVSRTRRNVRSVYATTGDNDGPSAKESSDAPRSTRKRPEKEVQETPVAVPSTPRRGRPPKVRRKTVGEVSPIKAETLKQDTEDTESKEVVDNAKPTEGWRSPRSQKSSQSHSPVSSNHQGKKCKGDPILQSVECSGESNEECPETTAAATEEESKPKLAKEEISEVKNDLKDTEIDTIPIENPTSDAAEKKISVEKAPKSKVGRPKNTKTLPRLKNVEIRLNADEVKGALRPHEDGEPIVISPVKIKSPQKEENVSPPPFTKPEGTSFPETPEKESPKEPKISPEEAQLARQMELEQAVENIEKITETATVRPYKDSQGGEGAESRTEEEGDKSTPQASETELAAAIGSIICDISADAETFPPAPPYPPEGETEATPATVPAPPQPDEPEPETNRAVSLPLQDNRTTPSSEPVLPAAAPVPSSQAEPVVDKEPEREPSSKVKEPERLPEAEPIPKRTRGRAASKKKRRSKKSETVDTNVFVQESTQGKSPRAEEKISDEGQKEQSGEMPVVPSPEKQNLDTSLNSSSDAVSKDGDEEFKDEDRSESANVCDSPQQLIIDDVSQGSVKLRSSTESAPITPPSIITPPAMPATPGKTAPSLPASLPHSAPAIVPDWIVRHDENTTISTPPPALPPDTKASDVDTSSSTLRKILMEPKYVSSPANTPSIVTAAISEPVSVSHVEEPSHPQVEAIKPVSEEKPSVPLPNTVVPPAAEAPVFQEKPTIVAPKATSVISRMPHSFDHEDLPRITSAKPHQPAPPCIPSQKSKQRQNTNDNRACLKQTMTVIEDRPAETGPSPGLRVNTSQGVMLLSYSGQKTEGPQRISAKISQIPPASAVDIEIQQSVSKTQIKQEPLQPSQILPKGPQTPTSYQPYNASPVISTIKQERSCLDKSESSHITGPNASLQPSAVKVLTSNSAPVLMHSQILSGQMVSSGKKHLDMKETKGLQSTNMSPHHTNMSPHHTNMSPHHSSHHSSLSGKMQPESNHVSTGTSTSDRSLPHLNIKQEPHSPCTTGHASSPFSRSCHPSVTASPALTSNPSVMLGPGLPVSPYLPSMHPEQTVIMPPHSVTQSLGHMTQGDVRINTPPLPTMQYGMRPEALHSPRAAMQPQMDVRPQRTNTPQPAPIREMVLPTLSSQHGADDDLHYHHPVSRGPSHVQSDVLVMQNEYRMPGSGMRLDPYSVPQDVIMPRDVRMMMHSHISAVGEHHQETRQSRTPEGPVKTPPASKTPQPVKELTKQPDVKLPHSQHNDARMLSGLNLSQPVVVPHGVPLIHSSGSSFHDYRPVYTDIRTYHPPAQLSHPQFSAASPIGLQSRSMTPSQVGPDGEHSHSNTPGRSKTPQVSQDPKAAQSSVGEQAHHAAIGRHPSQMESHIQHLQRASVDTSRETSYPSPVTINLKQDLPSPHQSQKPTPFMSSSAATLSRSDVPKQEPSQRSVDMVQLLTKYPIVWQGLLALKNDTAAVQLHFVSGNNVLAHRSLPAPEGGPPLRIAQRMRLEATQLEGVARRMMVESDYCLLLALPCGRDQEDVVNQTESLKAAFITYLQAKQAAGIINVPNPGSNQPAYVLQIFPPCEFSESHLSRLAPDLLASISNISPHLMIVIALA